MTTYKFRPNERAKQIFNFYADYYVSGSLSDVFALAFGKGKEPEGLDHDNNGNKTHTVYLRKGTKHNQTRGRLTIGVVEVK